MTSGTRCPRCGQDDVVGALLPGKPWHCRSCGVEFSPGDDTIPLVEAAPTAAELEDEERQLKRERFRYSVCSFLCGVPGFLLLLASLAVMRGPAARQLGAVGPTTLLAMEIGGTLLLMLGFAAEIRRRRYNPLWLLLLAFVLLSIVEPCLGLVDVFLTVALLGDEKGRRLKRIERQIEDMDASDE